MTALGVAAPALLFVSNVVLPEMTKCKPVHKSMDQTHGSDRKTIKKEEMVNGRAENTTLH